MIPDYCNDCFTRQAPTPAAPGAAPMMQGYPMQSMYQAQVPGTMQGTAQIPFQMPAGQQPFQQPAPFQGPPVDFAPEQGPTVQRDINYMQGWLATQVGQKVKIEFLIGTNMLVDREGTLLEVGVSYLLIRETETDDILMADFYSIKFVRIYL